LQNYHQFSFALTDRALEVKLGKALAESVPNLDQAQVLFDDAPPAGYFDCWLF
jgi:spermidine synthase